MVQKCGLQSVFKIINSWLKSAGVYWKKVIFRIPYNFLKFYKKSLIKKEAIRNRAKDYKTSNSIITMTKSMVDDSTELYFGVFFSINSATQWNFYLSNYDYSDSLGNHITIYNTQYRLGVHWTLCKSLNVQINLQYSSIC